jgi:hypothetical protein
MRFSEIDRNPSPRTLRQFAALWIVFFGGMAAWKTIASGFSAAGGVLAALAVAGGAIGLMTPAALRPIFVAWMMLVFPIGWVVSHLLLAVAYFGLFLPIGLWFRLIGRDPLRLRRPDRESYWTEKPQVDEATRYYDQY